MGNEKKIAVIVGGATVQGKDVALRLANDGYAIAVLDSDAVSGKEVAKEVDGIFVEFDVAKFNDAPSAMSKVVKQLGSINTMVNCPQTCPVGVAEDITVSDWDSAMDINLKGTFFAIMAAVPFMKKNEDGGNIVNISSMRGRQATGDHLLYSASMAAISAMSRELATDLWRYGIKCNTVAPWDVFANDDPKLKNADFASEQIGYLLTDRTIEPKDVSEVVSFLASDAAYCINAFEVPIDAGANFLREKPVESSYKK